METATRRCQLMLAPADAGSGRISRSGSFPPLGVLSLATYLRQRLGVEADVLDGEILPFEEIAERISADIVGISVSQLTYRNALALARIAKSRHAQVVFGGHHATAMATQILQRRLEVDWIVAGDGEEAITGLVAGRRPESISNLVYRDASGIVRTTPSTTVDPGSIPIPDRSLLDLSPYFENFRRQHPNKPFCRPFSLWTQKGCAWRDRSGGCSFCARTDTGWRARRPQAVWEEVRLLTQSYGADYIWELSDDVLANEPWLENLAETKPRDINPAFMFYARPANVTSHAVDLLQRLGAYEVFLGIESGDDDLLRRARRGSTSATSLNAVRLLGKRGIRVFPSFVLGLEGENAASLKTTEQHLLDLLGDAPVDAVAVCIFMPLPGSRAYLQLLSQPDLHERYADCDHIELSVLQSEWCRRFCEVSIEQLEAVRDRMVAHAPVVSGMGTRHAPTFGIAPSRL